MPKQQSSTHVSKRMKARAAQRRKKRIMQLAILAVVLLVAIGAAWALLSDQAPPTDVAQTEAAQETLPAEIDVDQAFELYDAGAFVLDVRTQEEWDEFHIPGTTLIPVDELEARVNEVPEDMDIVVVCRSGNRSQIGRDILRTAGFESVTSMTGGVSEWRDAGYPTE